MASRAQASCQQGPAPLPWASVPICHFGWSWVAALGPRVVSAAPTPRCLRPHCWQRPGSRVLLTATWWADGWCCWLVPHPRCKPGSLQVAQGFLCVARGCGGHIHQDSGQRSNTVPAAKGVCREGLCALQPCLLPLSTAS